jgi:hypothetical protein
MSQAENVNVTVTVGDVKVQFSGSAESIMASVMSFYELLIKAGAVYGSGKKNLAELFCPGAN